MPTISQRHRTYIQFLANEGLQAREIRRRLIQQGIDTISISGIQAVLTKLRRYHTVADLPRTGRPRLTRTPANVELVRQRIAEKRGLVSQNTLARQFNLNRATIRRILKDDLQMVCYRPVGTQMLTEATTRKRLEYARFILDTYVPQLEGIVFSDETYFSLGEHIHPQNNRIWSTEPRKANLPTDLLAQPTANFPEKVMVWAGISQQGKLPLIFFRPGLRLNAQGYQRLVLRQIIPEMVRLYENTPYADYKFIFQQDGASSHTARTTMTYLGNKGVQVFQQWPPSSPDLSVLDYFLFGTLKHRVYSPPAPTTMEELKQRIILEYENIPLDMIRRAIQQFPQRLQLVIEEEGGVIQHKIDKL